MSVDQVDVIDLISTDGAGDVVLTVSDHLDWSDSSHHQTILQKKLNAYLAFVESGEILQKYPDSAGRPILFKVVSKFRPDTEGSLFLKRAGEVIESAGFKLAHETFAES
jgi:hypothetical protein